MQINFTFQSILQRINSVQFSSIAQLCPTLCNPMDFPNIRVFSKESVLCIKWPKYWSFSFSISPSNEYSGLISFRMDWLDLLVLQGTLESSPTPQFKSTNSSVLSFLYSPNLPAHLPSAPVQQRGGDCRPQLPLQGCRPLGPWAGGALLLTLGCFQGALLTPLSRTKFRITLGVWIPAKELEKKVRLSPQTPYGGPQLKAKDWVCLMLTQHPRPGPSAEKTPWTISQETPTYTPSQATLPKRQGALRPLPYVLPTCVLFDQHRNIKRPLFTGPCVCQQGRGGRSGQRGLLEGRLLQVRKWTEPQHQRLRLHDR